MFDKLSGRFAPLVALALAVCLFLPGIGSFGLWDPHEVKIADAAKSAMQSGFTVVGKPPLETWAVAAGFKVFGVGEMGGRLPLALLAILAVVACCYVGQELLRRPRGESRGRAGLLAAVALATSPVFFLGARQLTSSVVQITAGLLAFGGLALAAWPRPGRPEWKRGVDFALGVLGLVLGQLSSGTMLGVATPLTAVTLAVIASGGPVGSWAIGLVGSAAAWIGIAVAWIGASPGHPHAGYSAIVGGIPHKASHAIEMVSILTQIGFGAFPWVAVLPLAAGRVFGGDEGDDAEARHYRYGKIAALSWIVVAYLTTTLFAAAVGPAPFAAIAAVALLAGVWLDDALEEPQPLAFGALVALLGAVVLAHDFFLQPEKLAGVHVLEGIRWPAPMQTAPLVILGLGIAWGVVMALALASRPGRGILSRQTLGLGAVAMAVAFAGMCTFYVVPGVSRHLSYRGLFTKYKTLGGATGELGQYRVPGHGAAYYNTGGKTVDLATLPQLFDFLRKPERVFVITGSEDAASIDQYAKGTQGAPAYFVVDDSNSQFLLLSNKLGPGEVDLNPLRRQIVASLPRAPQHEVHANFDNKVELVGYDLPAELERGHEFKITLYYKVNAPVGGSYKVFLHFDGPGTRFNGDHVPLEGRFPTTYWVPGFYVIDEHKMEPDRATAPAGWYQIYTGLFLGDQRLHVVSGPNDGEHRVKLGAVRVK